MIRICNWNEIFENNRSRAIESCTWVAVPNKHDGEGYATVMAQKDAAEIFAAWILMVQLASRVSKVRRDGSLVRPDGTPTSLAAMAVKTRVPESWFKKAVPVLLQVGWIEQVGEQEENERQADVTQTSCERQADDVRVPRREGKEEKGTGGKALARPSLPEVVEYVKSLGLHEQDGEYLFHHWEENGWKRGKEPIQNWKAAVQKWKAGQFFPSQKAQINGKPTTPQSAASELRQVNLFDRSAPKPA